MLNFEDELKKFSPSMEIEEVEDAVRGHELTDMTDIMIEMMRRQGEGAAQAQPVPPVSATQPLPVITNV